MATTPQETMKAAVIDQFGADTIKPKQLPVPDLAPDEVLIRIESAGVAVWDPFEREGGFVEMTKVEPKFPYVLGSDGAGTIAAVGRNVTRFKEGDRVYAFALTNPKGGFYAQYIAVHADNVSHIPGNLTVEQAGVMPVDAMTALTGLDEVIGLKQGETIMIFGASGGIGHMAVQLAKRMGARVLAVASGDDGVALAKRLGANAVVDGKSDDLTKAAKQFAPNGIDAALLTAGGSKAEEALTALREGGRVAYPHGVEPEPKVPRGIQAQGYDGRTDKQMVEKLNRLIESGPFEIHIDRTFPLEQATEAHQALNKHFLGKLALRPH